MNTVREFAERVLFGRSLEDKLRPPPTGLVDAAGGGALATPEAPGRPNELRLHGEGVRAEFPGTTGIEDDAQRGRLLHFFANHELLATELMALVLLKFPDAPEEFRAGVLDTLREEQMHTKLYLRRMAACGVTFGEMPVNGFFWNLVAPMATPLDYVTRLSLTFEQANLDYAKGYAGVFREAGDADTAAVLERIYRDEIGHVHYGLSWFRRWREGPSDWKSFCSLLDPPMSAARAKGAFAFNEAGRREAGLDEEFIRELKVFERSRGRTPNVYWFNPEAEDELAGRDPGRAARALRRDLDLLMAFVARKEDAILVEEAPDTAHLLALRAAGIEMPELVEWRDTDTLAERKLHRARPWAATPSACRRASELGLGLEPADPGLFSKIGHARFLERVIARGGWDLLGSPDTVGHVARTIGEVERRIAENAAPSWIVKAPLTTAGRGRVKLAGPVTPGQRDALSRLFEASPELLMEPWLDRVLDLSIQYDAGPDGMPRRRGFVVLENTAKGQFHRARVTRQPAAELAEEDRRAVFAGSPRRSGLVAWLENVFEPMLAEWLSASGFTGPLGIDAMFFRSRDGAPRFKPVVEINPRVTMGRIALELGRFRRGKGGAELIIQSAKRPAPAGALRLTPERAETRFAAYLA